MNSFRLRLFVSGKHSRSAEAAALVRKAVKEQAGVIHLEIVDVLENPVLAETDRVLATPTLIRYKPLPILRLIGDMTNPDKLRKFLSKSGTSIQRVQ